MHCIQLSHRPKRPAIRDLVPKVGDTRPGSAQDLGTSLGDLARRRLPSVWVNRLMLSTVRIKMKKKKKSMERELCIVFSTGPPGVGVAIGVGDRDQIEPLIACQRHYSMMLFGPLMMTKVSGQLSPQLANKCCQLITLPRVITQEMMSGTIIRCGIILGKMKFMPPCSRDSFLAMLKAHLSHSIHKFSPGRSPAKRTEQNRPAIGGINIS